MSDVYWGIVAGLGVLVATLFVCMDILYSNTNQPRDASNNLSDRSPHQTDRSATHGRHAA